MESQKIKDNRKAKFLAKLESKNKANKKETKKQTQPANNTNINQPPSQNNLFPPQQNMQTNQSTNIPSNQANQNVINNTINTNNNLNDFNLNNMIKNFNSLNNLFNLNLNNNQQKNLFNNNNEFTSNNINTQKINYNEILEKCNQYDYMINFQSFLKKILVIILSVIHCLNYAPLKESFVVKYTLVVLEISSLLFNKYYNDQKKQLTSNYNRNMNGQPPDQIEKISEFLMNNFGIFNQAFLIANTIKDIFADIAILFIINIIFFLLNSNN